MRFISIVVLIASSANLTLQRSPDLQQEDLVKVAELRRAGLAGDKSKISLMTEALASRHPKLRAAAIRALGHLAAAEPVPALTLMRGNDENPEVRDYAAVCRARVIAEQLGTTIADPIKRAQAVLSTFLSELGLSVEALNNARERQAEVNRRTHPPTVRELLALREIADIIYRRRFLALLDAIKSAGVDYEWDSPSLQKIRLAPLTVAQRIDALVEQLANLSVLKYDDEFTLQLAIDEGQAASRAAATKLQQMANDGDRFIYVGFVALFRMIYGVGDKQQAVVIESFLKHSNPKLVHYSEQVLGEIRAGVPHQFQMWY